MWLFTTFGFFSIVEKAGDRPGATLTVRARARGDLQVLKREYLPQLGTLTMKRSADYRYRATVKKAALAAAMRSIVTDINYADFKDAVCDRQGPAREEVYLGIWEAARRIQERPRTRVDRRRAIAS